MKKKLFGILVCTLLIATTCTIAVTGDKITNKINIVNNEINDDGTLIIDNFYSDTINYDETDYWGIIFDVNFQYEDYPSTGKEFLIDCGWKEDNIKDIFFATSKAVKDAISWVSEMADENDIVLLISNSHGGTGCIKLWDRLLYYEELDQWLDKLNVKVIIYCISACHSGSAIPIIGEEGRIIMTACGEEESAPTAWFLVNLFSNSDNIGYFGFYDVPVPNGAFYRKDCDLNQDGWISAEEAFVYAEEWTPTIYNFFNPDEPITPRLYDGFQGDVNLMNTSNLANISDYPSRTSISGPTEPKIGEKCTYMFSAIDSNGDQLSYSIFFDDEIVIAGPYESGETCIVSHYWNKSGDHTVKAYALDSNYLRGGFSIFEVSVPKNKPYVNTPFLRFLEGHPHLFPLLRQLLRL